MRMLPILLAVLFAAGCAQGPVSKTSPSAPAPTATGGAQGKKVVFIIGHQNFRDEELLKPRQILEQAGVKAVVASSALTPARGMLGAMVTPDLLVKDVKPQDYDAVIYVGGVGAEEYWNDKQAQDIARQTVAQGKLLAAICLAPVTLANAGVLNGKKATVWPSEGDRLTAKGAQYTGNEVEVEGRLITGNGPEAAEKFGQAVLKALGG
jgi:protease I